MSVDYLQTSSHSAPASSQLGPLGSGRECESLMAGWQLCKLEGTCPLKTVWPPLVWIITILACGSCFDFLCSFPEKSEISIFMWNLHIFKHEQKIPLGAGGGQLCNYNQRNQTRWPASLWGPPVCSLYLSCYPGTAHILYPRTLSSSPQESGWGWLWGRRR